MGMNTDVDTDADTDSDTGCGIRDTGYGLRILQHMVAFARARIFHRCTKRKFIAGKFLVHVQQKTGQQQGSENDTYFWRGVRSRKVRTHCIHAWRDRNCFNYAARITWLIHISFTLARYLVCAGHDMGQGRDRALQKDRLETGISTWQHSRQGRDMTLGQ